MFINSLILHRLILIKNTNGVDEIKVSMIILSIESNFELKF